MPTLSPADPALRAILVETFPRDGESWDAIAQQIAPFFEVIPTVGTRAADTLETARLARAWSGDVTGTSKKLGNLRFNLRAAATSLWPEALVALAEIGEHLQVTGEGHAGLWTVLVPVAVSIHLLHATLEHAHLPLSPDDAAVLYLLYRFSHGRKVVGRDGFYASLAEQPDGLHLSPEAVVASLARLERLCCLRISDLDDEITLCETIVIEPADDGFRATR